LSACRCIFAVGKLNLVEAAIIVLVMSLIVFFTVALSSVLVAANSDVRITTSTGGEQLAAEQHTAIRLLCHVPSSASSTVTWTRNGNPVVASGEVRMSEAEPADEPEEGHDDHTEMQLEIEEAEQEHAGVYKCRAGGAESANQVTVTVSKTQHPVKVAKPTVSVAPGGDLTLTCEADLHTDLGWFKGEVKITDGAVETKDEGAHIKTLTLLRRNVVAADAGVYSCRNLHHTDDSQQTVVSIGLTAGGSSVQQQLHTAATLIGALSAGYVAKMFL